MGPGTAIAGWSLLAAGFSWIACVRLWRRKTLPVLPRPPVVLLRPLDAPTHQELKNLQLPLPEHVLQFVLSPEEPRQPYTGQWIPSDPTTPNRKVGHLLKGLSLVRPRACVVSLDADVVADEALLTALCTPIQTGAALSTAFLQVPSPTSMGGWALKGLLEHTHQSFSAQDVMRAGPKAICGKAVGWSSRALELLPGLAESLGEDLHLSELLHQKNEPVVLASAPARLTVAQRLTVATVVARLTRWMQVLRAHRPLLYPWVPALFCCTPLLIVAALATAQWGALVVLLVSRTALAAMLGARSWELLAWLWGESVLLIAFGQSLFRRAVVWRGRTFDVTAGGRLRGQGGLG